VGKGRYFQTAAEKTCWSQEEELSERGEGMTQRGGGKGWNFERGGGEGEAISGRGEKFLGSGRRRPRKVIISKKMDVARRGFIGEKSS